MSLHKKVSSDHGRTHHSRDRHERRKVVKGLLKTWSYAEGSTPSVNRGCSAHISGLNSQYLNITPGMKYTLFHELRSGKIRTLVNYAEVILIHKYEMDSFQK